jgi:hypothetical protein
MRAILISELFLTPLLRFLDISGNIQRHVIAPRALTQSEMNLNFLGTPYRLGERFTVRITGMPVSDPRLITWLIHFGFLFYLYFLTKGLDQCPIRLLLLQQSLSFCLFLWICNSGGPILHR